MRILITGAAGFLGARLARTLLASPKLTLAGKTGPLDELWLTDQFAPPPELLADPRVRERTGNLCALLAQKQLEIGAMDAIVHLAAAVSAECEADLDLGLESNLRTSLELLQAARHGGRCPLFVFASSLAVFGAPPGHSLPSLITDDYLPQPQGSYGAQKFMVEQLVSDFSRRGLIVGRNVRLMTVSIRPGRPARCATWIWTSRARTPRRSPANTWPGSTVAIAKIPVDRGSPFSTCSMPTIRTSSPRDSRRDSPPVRTRTGPTCCATGRESTRAS